MKAFVLCHPLAAQLSKAELTSERSSKLPLLCALVAPIVGMSRVLSRLGSEKPVALLVVSTVAATVLAVWVFRPRRQRTALGDAVIARARDVHEPLQGRASAIELAENGTLPTMFALFGVATIAGLPLWTSLLDRPIASYTAGGCGASSGDGGGGDSDGGGGCGGCSGGCGSD